MFLCLCYRNDLYPRWQLHRSSSPPLWSMMTRVLVSSAMRTWTIMTPAVSAVVIVSTLMYVYTHNTHTHTHTHTNTYTHRCTPKTQPGECLECTYSTTKLISSCPVKKNDCISFACTCCLPNLMVAILSGYKTWFNNGSVFRRKTTSEILQLILMGGASATIAKNNFSKMFLKCYTTSKENFPFEATFIS